MVVVAANQILDHVVAQQLHFQGTGNLHSARTTNYQSLDFLRTQHSAYATAAGVAEGGYHAAHGNQVFTSLADGRYVEFIAIGLGQGSVGFKGALAPYFGSIFDGYLLVVDLDIYGLIALTFHNQGVIAGIFEGVCNVTAHMSVHNGITLGPAGQAGDVHTSGAGYAGSGQRSNSKHNLCIRTQGIGVQRHFVPDDLVSQAHAADVGLILGQGVFGGDSAGGQVNTQHGTRPAVDAILNRHFLFPPLYGGKAPRQIC